MVPADVEFANSRGESVNGQRFALATVGQSTDALQALV